MQKISSQSAEMIKDCEAKRNWVKEHYIDESVSKYETTEGKLHLLDTILKSGWIEKNETLKLQCLGITLGDIFVQDMGCDWIEIADEYGIDPALKVPDTSIILYPLTMVSKRIETGETVDIYELYYGIKENIQEIKNDMHNTK